MATIAALSGRWALRLAWLALAAACAEGSSIEGGSDSASSGGGSAPSGAGGDGGAGGLAGATTATGPATSSTGSGGEGPTTGGSGGGGGNTSTSTASSTGTGGVDQACPPGELVTSIAGDGKIACAPFAPAAIAAFASGCSLVLGWRDSCDGCTTAPSKWGLARTGFCQNGAGANGTCALTTLGATTLQVFGLNTDGDVNDDDKFHLAFHCVEGDEVGQPGPCGANEFVSGVSGGVVTCTNASAAALGAVRESCEAYLGWRDTCDGCIDPPTSWGRTSSATCAVGAGATTTCAPTVLGGQSYQLLGVNTGGDVNDDDKFYAALHCADPSPEGATVAGACPAGQLVAGVRANGTLDCESPAPLAVEAFRGGCTAYLGWRDSCDGCTTAPTKWGSFGAQSCAIGAGAGTTCVATSLGGTSVGLLGVNTDGDVNDDDKFFVGMLCQ